LEVHRVVICLVELPQGSRGRRETRNLSAS
jgi:hypothetical protein